MIDPQSNDDMSEAARAGDQRRMWLTLLHYTAADQRGLRSVFNEARSVGRGHHLVFALAEQLVAVLQLKDHPERIDEIREQIARLTEIQNSDEQENTDD